MFAAPRNCSLLAALLLVAVPAWSGPNDDDAKVIPMIAVDSYAPTALWTQVFIEYFMPEVDRRLAETDNYRIRWNKAFGGTIAKTRGVLDALQYDLADIGIVTTPYHSDKVPFYNLPYVTPFVSANIGLVSRTMSELVERYPELAAEWQDYRQVYLTTAGAIDTYQILTSFPVDSLEDFRGRKIAGVGPNLRYLVGLDATSVNSGLSDWYNNLATGLVDGVISWVEGSVAYRLYEVAPYLVDVRLGAVSTKVINVNARTWARLPDEVRTVLREVAEDYRDELAREVDRRAAQSTIEFRNLGGKIITFDDGQRRDWALSLPNLARDWVETMDAKGLPGRAILHDYMEIMRAAGQPIVRQWDSE